MEADLVKREKDNDNIYHHEVLPSSSLVPITQRSLVTSEIPPELADPTRILGSDHLIFSGLVGWGAKEAISESRAPFITLSRLMYMYKISILIGRNA